MERRVSPGPHGRSFQESRFSGIIGKGRLGHMPLGQHIETATQPVSTPLAPSFGRHFETDFRDVDGH